MDLLQLLNQTIKARDPTKQQKTSTPPPDQTKLVTYREWFQNSVSHENSWRSQAREDIAFYAGQQWDAQAIEALKSKKRPAITINKIRPLINLLSGYQRLNRYEPDFLPRTGDDLGKCKIAKGITKYLFDTNDYDGTESRVALDAFLTGRGVFGINWKWHWETQEYDISMERLSPFDIYLDPECKSADLSDAEFIHHARWTTADKVKKSFPDQADYIDGMIAIDDTDENDNSMEHIWFDSGRKKVRLVSTWYKEYGTETRYILPTGEEIPEDKANPIVKAIAVGTDQVSTCKINVATYLGTVLLEDKPSPYKHGRFPFVIVPAYWLGEGDEAAGVIRDLKDPQREMNKRRSQMLQIINTMASRGWKVARGSMTPEDITDLKKHGSEPGYILEFNPGQQPPQEYAMDQIPSTFFQVDRQSSDDLHEISGINEAMMGMAPASQSGRAKELDQRQAVVGITVLFDNLRSAKKRLLWLLWGRQNCPGLIPQFYKGEKVFRITQEDGKPGFIRVNQQQQGFDPMTGQTIYKVLNDLTTFQFDVIISDTPATPSQRLSAFYALLEMGKIGIPVPPDVILEASDIPQKEVLKQRMMAAQQQQSPPPGQQQAQAPPGQPGQPPLTPNMGSGSADIAQILSQMKG